MDKRFARDLSGQTLQQESRVHRWEIEERDPACPHGHRPLAQADLPPIDGPTAMCLPKVTSVVPLDISAAGGGKI